MSNSIWKTPDEKPKSFSFILEHHKAYDCDYHKNVEAYNVFETGGNPQNPFDEDTIRWCHLDELLAQADKVERLQEAVDLALDTLERTQKKCRKAKMTEINYGKIDGIEAVATKATSKIKQLIKGNNQ